MTFNVKHIVGHILFWVVIMLAFAVSEWGYRDGFVDAVIFELIYLPSRLLAVYINWFILIPKYLYKSRMLAYFISLVIVLITVGIGHRFFVLYWGYPVFFPEWMAGSLIEPFNIPRLVQAILIIVSPVAFTTGFKLFMTWYKSREEAENLKKEKKEAEIKFLKSQTQPHFLFNSLNSIYGLALEKSDKTPQLILKLSNILSYSLYDSNADLIELKKELELIENIIGLESERFGKRVNIKLQREGNEDGIFIPPLILLPLIENAFKHGIKDEIHSGKIEISSKITTHNEFHFRIKNTVPDSGISSQKGGLGLSNLKRRLELIYGGQMSVIINGRNHSFEVILIIRNPYHEP